MATEILSGTSDLNSPWSFSTQRDFIDAIATVSIVFGDNYAHNMQRAVGYIDGYGSGNSNMYVFCAYQGKYTTPNGTSNASWNKDGIGSTSKLFLDRSGGNSIVITYTRIPIFSSLTDAIAYSNCETYDASTIVWGTPNPITKRIVNIGSNLGTIISSDISNYFQSLGAAISYVNGQQIYRNTSTMPDITLGTTIGENHATAHYLSPNGYFEITNEDYNFGGKCHLLGAYSGKHFDRTIYSISENNYTLRAYVSFVVDDGTHIGWAIAISRVNKLWVMYAYGGDLETYNAILSEEYQPYIWTAVTSVTGNGTTYNLSQIQNINDAEAVTGASSSAFSVLNTESKVDVLVQAQL